MKYNQRRLNDFTDRSEGHPGVLELATVQDCVALPQRNQQPRGGALQRERTGVR